MSFEIKDTDDFANLVELIITTPPASAPHQAASDFASAAYTATSVANSLARSPNYYGREWLDPVFFGLAERADVPIVVDKEEAIRTATHFVSANLTRLPPAVLDGYIEALAINCRGAEWAVYHAPGGGWQFDPRYRSCWAGADALLDIATVTGQHKPAPAKQAMAALVRLFADNHVATLRALAEDANLPVDVFLIGYIYWRTLLKAVRRMPATATAVYAALDELSDSSAPENLACIGDLSQTLLGVGQGYNMASLAPATLRERMAGHGLSDRFFAQFSGLCLSGLKIETDGDLCHTNAVLLGGMAAHLYSNGEAERMITANIIMDLKDGTNPRYSGKPHQMTEKFLTAFKNAITAMRAAPAEPSSPRSSSPGPGAPDVG